ncbi:MAG: hypothetical protein VB040_11660 [Propionibacterium sp.]|nr:hypothetical protein [Propionibacterium sp.]
MIHLYDTRWATYEPDGSTRPMTEDEKANRLYPMPRYWVHEADVDRKVQGRWDKNWFFGWRDICRATDERTSISTLLPRVALGNKIPIAMPDCSLDQVAMLQATLSSFALDFAARQKLGSITMNYFVFMQLPVLRPDAFARSDLPVWGGLPAWLSQRVDRLNGWIPDEQERARVRAELDALMFHVYGLTRPEVSYVMDTFPIVKRKDEAAFGTYQTKDLILSAYDAMAEARSSGRTYQPPWSQEVHR